MLSIKFYINLVFIIKFYIIFAFYNDFVELID